MQEFIQQAAQTLGIGEDKVQAATGGLLGLVKQHADGADFAELTAKVPGLGALADAAPASDAGGGGIGGMLGGLKDAIGGGGGALGVLDAFTKSGLGADQIKTYLEMLTGFLQDKVGGDLLQRVLSAVPGLDKLAG